jgi:FKBP-type peptidyl-prolyl cis-trans isomerase (trigger factor)
MAAKKMSEVARGITLLTEADGEGLPAARGDRIIFNMKIWLNRGDEVPLNAIQARLVPEKRIRNVAGEKLVDHTATLGKREVIAGVDRSLMGMKAGGYRKVRISPHLAYREKGLPGVIPEHAVLVVEIWLRGILPA